MKRALLILGIFGFAIVASGQTPAQVLRVPISATNVVDTGNTMQYRGNVQISIGNSVVVADEVDVPTTRFNSDGSPNAIQLRGNVRLTFANDTPVLLEGK